MPLVKTYVYSNDPILQLGVRTQLRAAPEVQLVDTADVDIADVAVVVADTLDDSTIRVIRAVRRDSSPRTLLVASVIDERTLLAAAEAGTHGLLRRSDADPATLVRSVLRIAAGGSDVPQDLVGHLLNHIGAVQRHVLAPRGLTFARLNDRETLILRRIAAGDDTAEIAAQLNYSQRTIKNILHDINSRLQLRNRTHAVAYAVREGLI